MIFKKRVDPDYQEWRIKVLERDNYTCQMPECGARHKLIVHHIVPYKKSFALRTDESNGITLCRRCHKQTFGKESKYAHIFLSILYARGITNAINSS